MRILLTIFLLFTIVSSLNAAEKSKISIFYKERKPSQKVLEKVKKLLENYSDTYQIEYFNIEDEKNIDRIKSFGLPTTHFPFAVIINGKFTANIAGTQIAFVHFPHFMKGIRRHEGNWSLETLKTVLENNNLLADKNILPILNEEKETSNCGE